MENNLTTLSELPKDLDLGFWPLRWITKEEAKLTWPHRERLNKEQEE